MMIREPAVAGKFYADDPKQCLADVEACARRAASDAAETSGKGEANLPSADRIIGGVVPHAGWVFSGAVAARVFAAMAAGEHPQAIVVFGAIHVLHGPRPTVFPSGAWQTPLGLAHIDDRLAERLHGQTGLLDVDPHAHDAEHSIEVEVPFIQHLMPDALVVPIMVPVNDKAAALGRSVGRTCRDYGVRAAFICSTDLTHYGPSFNFTPQGVGAEALRWSKEVNDRRMIDLMLAMRAEGAVEEAVKHRNACGGGAIAATLAACAAYGARRTHLLEHTTSAEVGRELSLAASPDAVGYAGIVIE